MRKLIRNSFWFVLCVVGLYFSTLYVLSNIQYNGKPLIYITNDYFIWKGGGTYEKFKERDSIKGMDVIIVGSSRAYRSYNPFYFKEMGYSAWNLGSSAQVIENSKAVIQNVIIPAKPKYILLDVARLGFEQESIESSVDLITNTSFNGLKQDLLFNTRDIRLMNTYFVAFFNADKPAMYEDKEYLGRGFSTLSDSLNENWLSQLENLSEERKNSKQIKDVGVLEDILILCKNKNQKIVLVHSPVSAFYSENAQQDFVNKISALANKYQVSFYDLQNVEGIETKYHFYDDSHLNKSGVQLFNKVLLKKVKFE